jgi:peptide methionine sulfoxide reductase MsrB
MGVYLLCNRQCLSWRTSEEKYSIHFSEGVYKANNSGSQLFFSLLKKKSLICLPTFQKLVLTELEIWLGGWDHSLLLQRTQIQFSALPLQLKIF